MKRDISYRDTEVGVDEIITLLDSSLKFIRHVFVGL